MSIFRRTKKSSEKKKLPYELQTKLMAGKIDIGEIKKIVNEYNLGGVELNSIATGLRIRGELDLAEKYFCDSLKADETDGDVYGNLISLYCKQKKYGKCQIIFTIGLKRAARSREFIYYHQARALFNQREYPKAISIALDGINEGPPYELLYVLCVKAMIIMWQSARKANASKETIIDFYKNALLTTKAGLARFPDSKELQEIYKNLTK